MEFIIQLVLIIVGFVLLVKGADFFVEGASSLALKLGMPELIIGLTIVAMGTSAPEAAVSISAALRGSADITIGNILGSNILNVLVILGLTATIVNVKIAKETIKVDMPFLIAISCLLLIFGLTGNVINLIEGAILLAIFIGYLVHLFFASKKQSKADDDDDEEINDMPIWKILLYLAVGLAGIILGSDFVVDGATGVAKLIGISERFIGLTVVALGTSLPELVTSVVAAKKGKADLAIGNIVGSNLFNIMLVVGLSALITPVVFASNFLVDAIIAIAGVVMLFVFVAKKKELTRFAGITMLLCYAGYFVYLIV